MKVKGRFRKRQYLGLVTVGLVSLGATTDHESKSSDILDRLERRLLDQERNALGFSSEPSLNTSKATSSFMYTPKSIEELSPSNEDIIKFNDAITSLEAQVEGLASQVQLVKQKIIADASIDNLVSITTKMENPDRLGFRSLNVKIDGHLVYEQNVSLGLWLPENSIPLFFGPMQPGNHRLDFEARIVQRGNDTLPLDSDTHFIVNESYQFKVAMGKVTPKWEVLLAKKEDHENAKATFKELK